MATITTLSLLYHVRLAVNDLDTNRATVIEGNWMHNADYQGFIAQGLIGSEAVHTFQLRATGLWKIDGYGGNPYALRFASDTAPFTPTPVTSNVYVANAFGSIETTGTDTTASYSVTAATVDYNYVMSELYWWLANHRAIQMANANGAYVGETSKQLRDASGFWLGIISPEMKHRLTERGGILRH